MQLSENRWEMINNGIEWNVEADRRLPHEDHIEMSGLRVSFLLRYGVTGNGELFLERTPVWPTLRMIPNDTHASFRCNVAAENVPFFEAEGKRLPERLKRVRFDGILSFVSSSDSGLEISRDLFPSTESRAILERIRIFNRGESTARLSARAGKTPPNGRGCLGVYVIDSVLNPLGEFELAPGEGRTFTQTISARTANEPFQLLDADAELLKRRARIAEIVAPLRLESGNPELDAAFHFAKIRAGESIFKTRGGVMHSPGGGAFYAATWCNDQVEYAGPWFAFCGDSLAQEASLTAYRQYMPFMGPDYTPIPSSVIAEGFDIWEGVGDRGDAAMYAYGASRFALASGSRAMALELWPAIEWCLEYCRRKLTPDGVVASDSDELEGRLPAGKTNLCTSSLYYGGLRSAACLADSLNLPTAGRCYTEQADRLEAAIDAFFGREIHGFKTYRYCDGSDLLRSWISIPLCMGILCRAEGTLDALFSPRLWTGNGILSQEGDRIFWDRSTLYSFRGGLIAGAVDTVFPKLIAYTRARLLGDHVPYPVEAWPEGGQRHLSAESALFCRIITEGLFGITPCGLRSFQVMPRIPAGTGEIALRKIRAFGSQFDLIADASTVRVERDGAVVWRGRPGDVVTFHSAKEL